jgi:hypothetical protein
MLRLRDDWRSTVLRPMSEAFNTTERRDEGYAKKKAGGRRLVVFLVSDCRR